MSQFDVHPNPAGRSKGYPLVVQLQSDLVDLGNREVVIAPLVPAAMLGVKESVLLPVVRYAGADYRIAVPMLRSIQQRRLGSPIGEVRESRRAILTAVDRLFTGG